MVPTVVQRLRISLLAALRILCMLFGSSVALYFLYWIKSTLILRKLKKKYDRTKLSDTYEYIVCGAGSAGCVVARRLAEAGHKTLLIEAGENDEGNTVASTPLTCIATQMSDVDWKYKTVAQKYSCEACEGRKSYWPRGKVLGGSSNLNYMCYMRGQPGDFNLWERDFGCKGWSWEDVLPFYMKSENNNRPRPGHASGGLLGVSDVNTRLNKVANIFVEACRRLGMNEGENGNGADPLGGFRHQFTIYEGRRQSASHCFLHGTWGGKENLDIITSAHVLKVNFKFLRSVSGAVSPNFKPIAIGVCIRKRNGECLNVRASRETILCGGSIGSPQILMCSGIGRKADLTNLGINVIHDSSEVGQNLQDHLFTLLNHRIKTEDASVLSTDTVSINDVLKYRLYGRGVFSTSCLEATAFVKPEMLDAVEDPVPERNVKTSSVVHSDPSIPPIQLQFFAAAMDPEGIYEKANVDKAYRHGKQYVNNTCSVAVVLSHPHSRGTITLKSSDPLEDPLIDPNYLSDERDIETIIKGVILADKIRNAKPFSDISHKNQVYYYKNDVPRFGKDGVINTDAWRTTIRRYSRTTYHPVGTCRMGDDPRTSVCDPQLRVHGVSGLRIADLSICPGLTSGNTNAPAMMIGERCADFILSASS